MLELTSTCAAQTGTRHKHSSPHRAGPKRINIRSLSRLWTSYTTFSSSIFHPPTSLPSKGSCATLCSTVTWLNGTRVYAMKASQFAYSITSRNRWQPLVRESNLELSPIALHRLYVPPTTPVNICVPPSLRRPHYSLYQNLSHSFYLYLAVNPVPCSFICFSPVMCHLPPHLFIREISYRRLIATTSYLTGRLKNDPSRRADEVRPISPWSVYTARCDILGLHSEMGCSSTA